MTGNIGLFQYLGNDVLASIPYLCNYMPYNTTGVMQSWESTQVIAEGSSVNGPNSGSFGRTISMFKKGFGDGTAKGGEMDNLYLVLRQDARDGVKADGCTILADVGVYDIDSFVGFMEGATTTFARADNSIIHRMSYQIGCKDQLSGESSIFYAKAAVGVTKDALHVVMEGTATFSYVIRVQSPDHVVYSLNGAGIEAMASYASNSTVYRWVDSSGTMHWVNNAQNVDLMMLDQAGNLQLHSALDLTPIPYSSRPPIKQGRAWFNANTGQLMLCRDGSTWSAL